MARRGLFLDRDGVLNERRLPFVHRPEAFRWRPGAREALARAKAAGFVLVLATNQWPVGAGLLSRDRLDEIHARMRREAADAGGALDRVEACTHASWQRCDCRKPSPRMLQDASRALDLDLARSWMVGDQLKDVRAAHAAGARAALVNAHWRPATLLHARREADLVAPGLPEALDRILQTAPRR